MVEELLEAGDPRGSADDAQMQADRQHARCACAFRVQPVEGGDAVAREILREGEAAAVEEAHVVGVERIGQDDMGMPANLDDIGQIVVVGVGIVEEAAMLDEQRTGAFARRGAGVEADRRRAGGGAERCHRTGDRRSLGGLVHVDMALPAPAMGRDLMSARNGFLRDPGR